MEPMFFAIAAVGRTAFKLMGYDIRITGIENIPETGGAVVATNHIGYLDFMFSGLAVYKRGRPQRYLAKREIWDNKWAAFVMKRAKHIPVDRSSDPATAFKAAVTELKRGEILGMYPEATISPSFVPRPGKTGAIRMAQMAGVPVVPAAVWGSHRILTKWRPKNLQRKIAISVNVGVPYLIPSDADPYEATVDLMARITTLLDEAQDSYPQQPANDADRWWLPAHRGGTAPTPEEAEELLAKQRAEEASRRAEPDKDD